MRYVKFHVIARLNRRHLSRLEQERRSFFFTANVDRLRGGYVPVDLLTNFTMNDDLRMPFYRIPSWTRWQFGNTFDNTQNTCFSTQI